MPAVWWFSPRPGGPEVRPHDVGGTPRRGTELGQVRPGYVSPQSVVLARLPDAHPLVSGGTRRGEPRFRLGRIGERRREGQTAANPPHRSGEKNYQDIFINLEAAFMRMLFNMYCYKSFRRTGSLGTAAGPWSGSPAIPPETKGLGAGESSGNRADRIVHSTATPKNRDPTVTTAHPERGHRSVRRMTGKGGDTTDRGTTYRGVRDTRGTRSPGVLSGVHCRGPEGS